MEQVFQKLLQSLITGIPNDELETFRPKVSRCHGYFNPFHLYHCLTKGIVVFVLFCFVA